MNAQLSGCSFESSCSHLNFRFRACFEEGVPWHSSNYRVWIHSETRTWHDKNIQSRLITFQLIVFSIYWYIHGRPVNILFDHLVDVLIWRPRNFLIWHPKDVLIWRPKYVMNQPPGTYFGRYSLTCLEGLLEDLLRTLWGSLGVVS